MNLASANQVVCNCTLKVISKCFFCDQHVVNKPVTRRMKQGCSGILLHTILCAAVRQNIGDVLTPRRPRTLSKAHCMSLSDVVAKSAALLTGGGKQLDIISGTAIRREVDDT